MRKLTPGLVALAAAAAFSVWAYPQLPAQVATHFNIHGQPDGWSSRMVAVVLAPAIGVGLAFLLYFLPGIDPRKANYARFGSTWWTIANALLFFIAGIHVVTLGKAMGWAIDVGRVMGIGVGALFILLGNLMTRVRPNWFLGIRTPWTLSSDTVWTRTHRFGGVAFVLAGLGMVVTGLLRPDWTFYAVVALALVAGLASVVYSYVRWKAEGNGHPSGPPRPGAPGPGGPPGPADGTAPVRVPASGSQQGV